MLKHPLNKTGKRTYGGGSGKGEYFIVEARSTYDKPRIVSLHEIPDLSFVLDNEWRRVPINEADGCGLSVPVRELFHDDARRLGLMNYEAAMALAHLFIATLDFACLEVRLVKVHFEQSYETWEMGVGEIINRSDGPHPEFHERETEDIPLSAREVRA